MRGAESERESGFTLLEVLIALAVLAVGAALTLSLISGSLGNIRKVQLRARTIQHAETVMELSLLDESVRRPTTLQGDFEDGTRWQVRIDEFQLPEAPTTALQLQEQLQQPDIGLRLFSYTAEVFAPGSAAPDYRLQTLKVVNINEPLAPIGLQR
jgi:prepilin-type N-terminal cleavage/methylation domain-containing protein